MTETNAAAPTRRATHPIVYLILYLPYGIGAGYVNVTLAWMLSHAGATVEAIAVLTSMALLANTWKVLWSPLIDTTLTAKTWYVIGLIATAASFVAFAFLPLKTDLLSVFGWLALTGGVAGTITSIAVDRLMAFDVPDHLKGQAGGWSQAGNLGGAGLGGGAGLLLAQHSGHPWIAGVILAAACIPCLWPMFMVTEPGRVGAGKTYWATLKETGADVLVLIKTRIGLLACFLMLLPIGSGGLQQLWGAIAKDWNAGPDEVALVAGALSGLASIPGCIIGGWIADKIDRKRAYSLFGIALSAVAVGMALAPRTPLAFMIWACVYNAAVGFCYGAYSAVTLEAIGKGAAGTKFNLISSLSNAPILIVTLVDGWAETRFGATGMLYVEASMGVAGVVIYSLVALATRGMSWGVLFGKGRIAPVG
jgi:PAT family beta-lactamase induction signal transducer AmpG